MLNLLFVVYVSHMTRMYNEIRTCLLVGCGDARIHQIMGEEEKTPSRLLVVGWWGGVFSSISKKISIVDPLLLVNC